MTLLPPQRQLLADEVQRLADDPLALEDRDDLPSLVPRIPAQAFVAAARKLRDEQRLELLLPHATPDQLTSIADLEVWEKDRVAIPKARAWLLDIVRCYEHASKEHGQLIDLIYQMDPELWTLALMHATAVAELDLEDNMGLQIALDSLSALHTYETPDGFFVLGVPDNELGRSVLAIVDAVYRDSLEGGRRLVSSIKYSLASELEEMLLYWRKGRLADLGFPEWEDAMGLLRPMAIDAALGAAHEPAPGLSNADEGESKVVQSNADHDLLRRGMLALDPKEHGERSREFLLVANELLAAQRLEPGDETHQERAVLQSSATVSLGLERLIKAASPPDIDGFLAGRISAVGLRGLFQVGYGALALLRKAAHSLHSDGRVSVHEIGSLLDRPWGVSVRALSAWLPELALTSTSGTRPIRTLADVARATELVAAGGALASLCFHPDGYHVDPGWISRVDEPERLVLGDLIRTAIVHSSLPGASASLAPLGPRDLMWAQDNLLQNGALRPEIRADFERRCAAVGGESHAETLAQNILTRLEVELGSLEFVDGEADLRRAGGLMTVAQVSIWLGTSANSGSDPGQLN